MYSGDERVAGPVGVQERSDTVTLIVLGRHPEHLICACRTKEDRDDGFCKPCARAKCSDVAPVNREMPCVITGEVWLLS